MDGDEMETGIRMKAWMGMRMGMGWRHGWDGDGIE